MSSKPGNRKAGFNIVYTGAFTGWNAWQKPRGGHGVLHRALNAFDLWTVVELDHRGSSPIYVDRAILEAEAERQCLDLALLVRLTVFGNTYPGDSVNKVLADTGVGSVVQINGPFSPSTLSEILSTADARFIALPPRMEGAAGDRISAKTFEYLATDLPIIAAVPPSESCEYLKDTPGVFLTEPTDHDECRQSSLR